MTAILMGVLTSAICFIVYRSVFEERSAKEDDEAPKDDGAGR